MTPDRRRRVAGTPYLSGDVTALGVNNRAFYALGIGTSPADAKIVTFVSRGLESVRGFDVFMKVAARISRQRFEAVWEAYRNGAWSAYAVETVTRRA